MILSSQILKPARKGFIDLEKKYPNNVILNGYKCNPQ